MVRSEQSKLVRRSAKELKQLKRERASFDGSKPIKLLIFLRTGQETFDDGLVSEGFAARALYCLLGGEAQDLYTSRVTTGNNPSGGARPTPFTWPHVIHEMIQRYRNDDVLQEAYDSVTHDRQGADEDADAFAVRMEASARDCSGVFGQHDLVSYYVQGHPETIRHIVREKVSSLEHSEQENSLECAGSPWPKARPIVRGAIAPRRRRSQTSDGRRWLYRTTQSLRVDRPLRSP